MYSLNLFHPKIKSKNLFIDFIDKKKLFTFQKDEILLIFCIFLNLKIKGQIFKME